MTLKLNCTNAGTEARADAVTAQNDAAKKVKLKNQSTPRRVDTHLSWRSKIWRKTVSCQTNLIDKGRRKYLPNIYIGMFSCSMSIQ